MDYDGAPAYGLRSLLVTYVQLARREERDARAQFGDAYARYEANTPAFFPRLNAKVHV